MNENDYNNLSFQIIRGCMEVHRELGPGLLESVYEECLFEELKAMGLETSRQVELPVIYKSRQTHKTFFMDLVVEHKIVLELKAVEILLPIHEVQLVTYLKLSGLKLGLLVNFHVETMKSGIRRKINGNLNE